MWLSGSSTGASTTRGLLLWVSVWYTISYLPQMDAPMSDWFHSIPMALDTIAFAAKARVQLISFNAHLTNSPHQFQQETMGSQIRYYRSRNQQQRVLIDRMKRDIAEVKKYFFRASSPLVSVTRTPQDKRKLIGRECTAPAASSTPTAAWSRI